jgi:hypothetical protein
MILKPPELSVCTRMLSDDSWFNPRDTPDPWRFYGCVPSWALSETIWTPGWRDAYPPLPCLCSAWGGLSEESRIGAWAGI